MAQDIREVLAELRVEDIRVDENGRVIIDDPRIADRLREIVASHGFRPSPEETTNKKSCVNIICGEVPAGLLPSRDS